MKRYLKSFVVFAVLSLFLYPLKLSANAELPFDNPELTLSMDFKDADLKDILKVFSIQSGLNFIASEGVEARKITLYLDKVPIKDAMNKLFNANNLAYEMAEDSNIFVVKDMGKPQVETITKVFYLKYSSVSSSHMLEEIGNTATESSSGSTSSTGSTTGRYAVSGNIGITTAVTKLLSQYGTVIEDYRTNSLIVNDIPNRMPIISETISAIDVPVPQVMIEVEMLDVSKSSVDKIGFKYSQTPLTLNLIMTGATMASKFPWGSFLQGQGGVTNGSIGISNGTTNSPASTYQVLLDWLKTQADTRFLARPRILTLSNETAQFKIVTDETINIVQVTTSGQSINQVTSNQAERTETGVDLRVTPQVNLDSGEITMYITPTVKDTSTSSLASTIKDPEERSTRQIVRVMDGETIILGGLLRKQKSETITKLPVLGDIPLVGGLFRHRNKDKDTERELLIFITPHIMKESQLEFVQSKKVNLPVREQNASSRADRAVAINSSLNSLEKKK